VVVAQAGEAKPQRAARPGRGSAHSSVAAARPRLKLEPIDLDPQTLLRVTPSLAEPQGDPARRATAALLWQAINADPQELLRTTVMLQKLEADLAQMRQTHQQTRAELLALRQRLDQSRPAAGSALLQFLALLAAAAAAAAGVLWYRTRQLPAASAAWYADGMAAAGPEASARTESLPEEAQPEPMAAAAAPPRELASAVTAPVLAPARSSAEAASRVETLAATFEEVEFLSSLGLASDAMDALKSYLQDSASPSPLAFFELMRLCDPVEDAAALAAARRRYGQAFGVEAPRLEQVTASLGLESLTALGSRITAAWGTDEALAIIEDALLKAPTADAPLTLQAGRDLLCLHALARALAEEAGPPAAAHAREEPALAPWAHADDAAAALALVQAAADAQGGRHFALDVDLGAAPPPLPGPGPALQEVGAPTLDPLLAELQAAAERAHAEREHAARQAAQEEAFSAAMASERIPVSRF
jgi:hypothetical protein